MRTNVSKALLDKDSLSKQVLNQIRKDIILGTNRGRKHFVEIELAEKYNASRGTIRSALQELSSEGLVEFLNSGGCYAIEVNEKFIRDTYRFRQLLEIEAAKLILKKEDVVYTPLTEILDLYVKRSDNASFKSNPVNFCIDLDVRFHRAFMEVADNRPIYRAWCSFMPVIRALLEINVNSEYFVEFTEKFYVNHKKMLDYAILRNELLFDEIKKQTDAGMTMCVTIIRNLQKKTG